MATDRHLGKMYAVVAGDYGGSYLVVIESIDSSIGCLRLPDMTKLHVPADAFDRGVDKEIVNEVATIDKSVYNYCKHLYEKESNN